MEDKEDSMLNWVNPHSWVRIKDGIEYYFPTLAEIYSKYSVDGDFGVGDKGLLHSYIPEYEKLFAPYRNSFGQLLEIGANQCHSLKMWREYFSRRMRIIGVDIWSGSGDYVKGELIEVLCADATKPEFLDMLDRMEYGTADTLDIVIDDGSHQLSDQLASYELLKGKMNKGGIYIIEDLINFEVQKPIFEEMGFEVIDLREKKGRFDDALAIKYF